jgi:hypothetical protein
MVKQRVHDVVSSVLPFIFASWWFVRKWYLARKLKLHGIGKGGLCSRFTWSIQTLNDT